MRAFSQPAATVSSPYNWDLTLGQVAVAADTDYGFLTRSSAVSLLRASRGNGESGTIEDQNAFLLNGTRIGFGYKDGDRHYGRVGVEVAGPGLSVQLTPSTRVGLFTRARFLAGTRNIGGGFSQPTYDATPEGTRIAADEVYGAAAGWGELGLNVAQAIPAGYDGELRIGLNLRSLTTFAGASVFNPPGSTVIRMGIDSVGFENADITLSLTDEVREIEDAPLVKGRGFAGDLGFQYAWESMEGGGFRYSAGLAITDLGSLPFREASQTHRFRNPEEVLLTTTNYEDRNGADAYLRRLSLDVNKDSLSSAAGNDFDIGLPTSLGLQFTFRPTEDLQLSAALTGDLLRGGERLSQGDEVLVAAHYGKWWYGAGATVRVEQFRYVNVGGYLRAGPLVIGTNRLVGTLLPAGKFRGGDFYVGLRIHDFGGSGNGKDRGKRPSRRGKGKAVKCYSF